MAMNLNKVELSVLDLLIAAKEGDTSFDNVDLVDEVGEVVEAVLEVTEAIGGATAMIEALQTAAKPGTGLSLEALLEIRKRATQS